jgi:hypothetical protein
LLFLVYNSSILFPENTDLGATYFLTYEIAGKKESNKFGGYVLSNKLDSLIG